MEETSTGSYHQKKKLQLKWLNQCLGETYAGDYNLDDILIVLRMIVKIPDRKKTLAQVAK
jgi:hypothetical protein